jgi:DnaJ-class molecular chaperone
VSDDTHYTVLGVSEAATQSEIKAAYRNLLKQIHPDTVSTLSPDLRRIAEGATEDIIEAYSVLSDASKRRQYDRELGLGEHRLRQQQVHHHDEVNKNTSWVVKNPGLTGLAVLLLLVLLFFLVIRGVVDATYPPD